MGVNSNIIITVNDSSVKVSQMKRNMGMGKQTPY